jgi:hypothetical protein
MKVIKPTTITPSSIISSSLAETEVAWSSATTYSIGAVVYDGLDGIYQAVTSNTNKQPKNNPLDWTYIRPSNRWALFDSEASTVSTGTTTITFKIATGTLEGIAFLNLVANSVSITVTDGVSGPTIYQATQSLSSSTFFDWYEYFFRDTDTALIRTQAVFTDLPLLNYTNTYTEVTITGTGTVSIGTCTFGTISEIGSAEYGVTSGITDYSVKQTDEFGQTTFVRRAYSKRMSGRVLVDNKQLNSVQRTLYSLRAVPALWIASQNPDLEEALVVFGYYRDFSTDISYPNYSYCSLEIEGLI